MSGIACLFNMYSQNPPSVGFAFIFSGLRNSEQCNSPDIRWGGDIACGAPVDEGNRRTVPVVEFKASPGQ
jgi:hypothetical protein